MFVKNSADEAIVVVLNSIAFETCHLCKRFFYQEQLFSLNNIHKEIGKTEQVVMFNFNFLLFSLRGVIDLTVGCSELVTLLIVRSTLMRINAWTRDKLFFLRHPFPALWSHIENPFDPCAPDTITGNKKPHLLIYFYLMLWSLYCCCFLFAETSQMLVIVRGRH